VDTLLAEAKRLETVDSVSFEGGEPFLYYPIMVRAAETARNLGFRVEILTNCYWATCREDAMEWLLPLARDKSIELTVSSDLYHGNSWDTEPVVNALRAANSLNMKVGIIAVKYPNAQVPCPNEIEGVKLGLWETMYRGRAASNLTEKASRKHWREFTKCPYENFDKQERVHVDPFGHVHACQGISIGNAWRKPFSRIIEEYNPRENPILEPLIRGGPVALVETHNLSHEQTYADACHLCYTARVSLRRKYPEILCPIQMYGESE
jgi:organic radical activating enzyme